MYLLKNEPHFQENAVPSLPRKLQARTDRDGICKLAVASDQIIMQLDKGLLEDSMRLADIAVRICKF